MRAREQFYKVCGIRLTRKSHLRILGLLLCLQIVLAFSYLGFIQVPPISVTTLSILVIVAAAFFGPMDGIALSLVFAAASMWKASLTSVEEGDLIFSPTLSGKPVESLIMALLVRVVFALVAGLLFRWFFSRERKHRKLGIALISVAATGVHALLIYVCMVTFFGAADVETSSGFSQSLIWNNLILYAATVVVALGFDSLLLYPPVNHFISVTSEDNVRLSKRQKRVSLFVTVAIMLACILICIHFMTRLVRLLSGRGYYAGNASVSWVYSLLAQFVIGFAAAFGIIALVFRWVQEYFSLLASEARKDEQIRDNLVQNNARIFALEDNFESLYEVELKSGRYVSYVKGDFYQSNVYDKLVPANDFFDDLRINVEKVIYEEDRDEMYRILNRDAIRNGLAENEHFDHFYRVITENGLMWLKMRTVYKDAEKKNIVIGIFDAKEEMAEKEKNSRLLAAFASENELSVLLDLRSGTQTLLSNQGGIGEEITGLLASKDANRRYADQFVHPDDRTFFYSDVYTPEGARSKMEIGGSCSYEYRRKTDGDYVWYRAIFNRISKDEVIIGYRNCNEEVLQKQLREKVIADFASVFLVNLNNDTYRFVSRNSESGFADVPGGVYSDTIREYATRVNPDYREKWYKVSDLETVRGLLAKENRIEYVYPLEGVEKRWRRCILQTLDSENGVPSSFVMTYFVLDDSSAENFELNAKVAEQKAQLEEALTFTNFFLDTYVSAYYVNLDTFNCQIYKRTEILENEYPIVTNYLDSITDYIRRDVHPEDREEMLKIVQPEYMRSMLAEQSEYNHVFRDITEGTEKIYRMQVIRGAEENHAAFGFIDITEEINEQKKMLKEAEESQKIIESISSAYNLAYMVNQNSDAIRLIRMDERLAGKYRSFDTFTEAKEFFFRLLPASDREQMRFELEYDTIRNNLANTKSYTREYRVPENGAILWHEMNVTRVDEENFAIGFVQKDLEITQKHLEDKRYSEYFALYEVDLDTGMLKIVKDSPWYEIDRTGTALPYVPAMLKFAAGLDEEPREFFEKLADLNYVKQQLLTEDKHTYAYRSNNVGAKEWVDCTSYVTLRHSDGTPEMFTLGFSMIDSLGVYRQELQSRLNENMQMVGGLADRYDTLYYVNIREGTFKVYALDGEKYRETNSIVSEETDAFEAIRRFGSSPIVYPDDRYLFADLTAESVKERLAHSKKFSMRYRQADGGDYAWFEMEVVKYEEVDEPANALAIGFTNCDAETRAEQEHQRELEDAREAADAANQSKTNFLFNMSHDIRTPMNAIRGFTAMAKRHADDKEKVSEYLDKIDISGQQLLALINQVLEMARIESGKIEFDEQPMNMQEEFHSMVTVLSEQAKTNGLKFGYSLSGLEHNNVLADEAKLGSIALNITGNAMKYTPEGGSIQFDLKEIPGRKAGYASFVLTVSDTGIGMSEEFLQKLYDPFSREKNTTVSKIQGTGLGLSIVKSTIDLMGGDIEVRSELGKGTRFDITLDLRIDEKAAATAEYTEDLGTVSFGGRRVLLVEDNEMNREIARDILEDQGMIVEEAEDGDIAVARIQAIVDRGEPDYYDFILMDIQMPRMNGYEATREIRRISPGIHIPIIALSANAFAEDKSASIAAGMDDHVAKPINMIELYSTLAKHLS